MWTDENRARYDRSKLRYPSDLTEGRCQLGGGQAVVGFVSRFASCGRGNPGHFAPAAEGGVASLTAFGGREAMAAKLKVIVDPAVIGEETLGVAG